MSGGGFSVICVSPQDWDADLPTNRQQIMRRAAGRGHDVVFLETGDFLGRQLWSVVRRRGRHDLLRSLTTGRSELPSLRVRRSVNALPWGHRHRVPLRVNVSLTASVVAREVRRLPPPVVLWLYDPCYSGLVGRCGEAFAVYDCVDDYAQQADPAARALVAAADRRAATVSQLVFATTQSLYERCAAVNPRTALVPNVGDFEHFRGDRERPSPNGAVAALRRPVLGFAGNLVGAKVDFDLLRQLAGARPEWSLLLAGPLEAASREALDALVALPNVSWVGPVPYGDLPAYVTAFDVALIPYATNDYTASCFPLKLYEYLAAGKPVVATGLPALAGMAPDVRLVAGLDATIAAVEEALAERLPDDAARRMAIAERNSWDVRTGRLLDLVSAELGR